MSQLIFLLRATFIIIFLMQNWNMETSYFTVQLTSFCLYQLKTLHTNLSPKKQHLSPLRLLTALNLKTLRFFSFFNKTIQPYKNRVNIGFTTFVMIRFIIFTAFINEYVYKSNIRFWPEFFVVAIFFAIYKTIGMKQCDLLCVLPLYLSTYDI